MPNVVFVAPFLMPATVRFARETASLPGVRAVLLTQEPTESVPAELRQRMLAIHRVADALSAGQIVEAVRHLETRMGKVERLLGVLEHLQVPLAEARAALGIEGMKPPAAKSFRDKGRMKTVLREAGLPCARHLTVVDPAAAEVFAKEVGFPLVLKPPEGAGARSTFRVDDYDAFRSGLASLRPGPSQPVLIEEFVRGQEFSFDSVFVAGTCVWHSITEYLPGPLEVLENPWMQWCAMIRREDDEPAFEDIRQVGPKALAALGMQTGLSHMEWFRLPSGGLAISEVGARPPGAQISSLISYAHDFDLYRAWPHLMIYDEFRPPGRRFAAGVAFLRGQGQGRVKAVHGLDRAQEELGSLAIEVKLPAAGQPASSSYEGEGYVILRHPETAVLRRALHRLVSLVRVELA